MEFFTHWAFSVSNEKGILKKGNEKADTSAAWQPRKVLKKRCFESWTMDCVETNRWNPASVAGVLFNAIPRKGTVGQPTVEWPDALECGANQAV